MKKFVLLFAIALSSSLISVALVSHTNAKESRLLGIQSKSNEAGFSNQTEGISTNPDFTKAAELTVHAVVHVKTKYKAQIQGNPNDPFFNFFWGERVAPETSASGSGVIISNDGYIVTNNHVVNNADEIEVTLNDKRTYEAKVIGTDPTTDLALLKIDEKALPFIQYGNSDNLKVGEWVLAVGNPFNLTSTVTAGIVSAKGRNINILGGGAAIEAFIQTDAAVNPGNSGGALVNTNGELVGINAAIASNTGSYAGYSFAIPISIVKKVVTDLMEFGEVQRAYLGVTIRDLDSKLATEKGIKEIAGIYVESTFANGSAEKAGIDANDVITQIEGIKVNNVPELQELIGRHRPGDKVMLTIKRKGTEKEVEVNLLDKNGELRTTKVDVGEVLSTLGAKLEELSPAEAQKYGITGGLKVTNISDGLMKQAGVQPGFILTKIDKTPVKTNSDVTKLLQKKTGGVLFEGMYSNGMRAYYGIGLR